MKYIRSILRRVLCLLLIAAILPGCNRNTQHEETTPTQTTTATEATQETAPESTEPSTEATNPVVEENEEIPDIPLISSIQTGQPRTLEEWVIHNYDQTITWTDSAGSVNTVTITLPALAPVGDFAVHYNEQIHALGTAVLEAVRYDREEGLPASEVSLTYQAWLHDDILSILITRVLSKEIIVYRADSFDIDDHEALSTAELSEELLDLDYPQFLSVTNTLLTEEFDRLFGAEADKTIRDSIATDLVYLSQRDLYVGEGGKTYLVYTIPSPTAAGYHRGILPLTPGSIEPDSIPAESAAYDAFFALASHADGAYAEACALMLKDAFLADTEDFAKYAAQQNHISPSQLGKMIVSTLIHEDAVEFQWDCQELLKDDDASAQAKAVVSEIFKQYGH